MQYAPIPDNETDRLNALLALDVSNTISEERFDRITKLAADYFHVPISTLSPVSYTHLLTVP